MAVVGDAVVEVVKNVGRDEIYGVVNVVQFGVARGDGEDYFRGVDGGDIFASRDSGVDCNCRVGRRKTLFCARRLN